MNMPEKQTNGASIESQSQGRASSHISETIVQMSTRPTWEDETGYPLLPDEQPVSIVRDSLYDLIPLGLRELR